MRKSSVTMGRPPLGSDRGVWEGIRLGRWSNSGEFGRRAAIMSAVSNEPSRRRLFATVALCGAGALLASGALAAPAFDTRPVAAALARLLPQQAAQLELRTLDSPDGHERLRISGVAGG